MGLVLVRMVGYMGKVITQTDIMKYLGTETIFFEEGTIVTPSAKDWAKEQGIEIVLGNEEPKSKGSTERAEILKKIVTSVTENIKNSGQVVEKDGVFSTVTKCLERLGCKVE